GEIVLTISMLSKEDIEENKICSANDQMNKKGILLIELHDTGIGMNPEFIQHAWKSFSRGDMLMTRKQDGTGLGLSICKSLVEINGGEIKAESQLGEGSKFWFTWNIELLSSMTPTITKVPASLLLEAQYDKQITQFYKKKTNINNSPSIKVAQTYKELHNQSAYDIAFIGLYEDNEEE
ncbi:11445_t:CDS:2, partial [Racocetra persica]